MVKNAFGIFNEPVQSTTEYHGANAKVVRDIVFKRVVLSMSGLPNYSKNFYFSWCCSNSQRKSNPFLTNLKAISNHITIPLLKNFNPSYVNMSPIRSQNF